MVLDDLEASEAGKRSEEDVAKMFGFEDDYHQGLQRKCSFSTNPIISEPENAMVVNFFF